MPRRSPGKKIFTIPRQSIAFARTTAPSIYSESAAAKMFTSPLGAQADTMRKRIPIVVSRRPAGRVSLRRSVEGATSDFRCAIPTARTSAQTRKTRGRRRASDVVAKRQNARFSLYLRRRTAKRARSRRAHAMWASSVRPSTNSVSRRSTSPSGALHLLTPRDTYVYEYGWSPDGEQIAVTYAKGNGDDNWWIARLARVDVATASDARFACAGVSDQRSAVVARRQTDRDYRRYHERLRLNRRRRLSRRRRATARRATSPRRHRFRCNRCAGTTRRVSISIAHVTGTMRLMRLDVTTGHV